MPPLQAARLKAKCTEMSLKKYRVTAFGNLYPMLEAEFGFPLSRHRAPGWRGFFVVALLTQLNEKT